MPERRNRSELFRNRAREMRSQPNDAESMLWNALRNGRLKGFKFRRQHPIGPYIADFYCAGARLIVELDGKTHDGKEQYDAVRQGWLEAQGLAVMRYRNDDVIDCFEALLEAIWSKCVERTAEVTRSPGPSP